jgi:branched-subunit amino acid transport protein
LRPFLILFSQLQLGLWSVGFLSCFPTSILYTLVVSLRIVRR